MKYLFTLFNTVLTLKTIGRADAFARQERGEGLRKSLSNIGQVLGRGEEARQISVGSTVVAQTNLPELRIFQFQSYTVQGIWDQGVPPSSLNSVDNDNSGKGSNGLVEKIARHNLNEPVTPSYTRYISLFSPKHHEGPVTVNPKDVILVSLQEEVVDSVLMALPLFGFWTALAFSFATKYIDRYGGNFVDAMFGR